MSKAALPDDAAGTRTPEPQGRDAAVRLARKWFINSQRIEMRALADELGVSRMTINRWVGSRDQLIGTITWALAENALDRARDMSTGSGVEVVAGTLEGFIATVLDAPFQRAFLRQEGEIALRILTTRSSDVQRNFIAYVAELLRDELPESAERMPIEDLAYLLVRIAESFCYVDMICGGEPDARKVGVAVRVLLT
ncbi:QsdR family transcriptional regulator [Amycolatopsis pithecellobii]|uniref:TetR/AcrR family transcriptional regulator n=1 Tax=Amycolatopsis pithecellobii TaxID=664692 RepID=A0A6N7YPC9_9PSEU|nr:QsdR family transcriptional regulator [Amycolatopsis pithecellobii]MTD54857.1 TetR/AcrR family transcriptional regulator [Amycolatopsis pithecellobii]